MYSKMYKTPKGTKDIVGAEYLRQASLLRILEETFTYYGGEPLETPVFERRDVLLGKYGDEAETKLLYNLEN